MRQRRCVFCTEPIVGYGNSIRPLREGKGECCDECNGKIMIPYRMMMAARSTESRATEDVGGLACNEKPEHSVEDFRKKQASTQSDTL